MAVTMLDHVNVRTARMAESLRFYEDVLGMTVSVPPGMADLSEAAWIHSGDGRPVIHLNRAVDGPDFMGVDCDWTALSGSAQVHHVALRCTGYEQTRAHLEAEGLGIMCNDVPQAGLRQIFVRDPNDILIEMNFLGGE